MLTPKQIRFCQEYVIDLNATQAAIRAGYSKRSAASIGEENLRKPEILKFIDYLQEQLRKKAGITAEYVVQELRDLAEWNIQDFLDEGNRIKDLTKLSRNITKPVVGIKQTEKVDALGNPVITTELKLADKRASWVDLGRHTGAFKEDNDQRAMKIKVTRK